MTYVICVDWAAMLITGLSGHGWPDRIVSPGLELAAGVVIVIALSLLGSVVISSTANGIAVFMLFGAGLVAGLLFLGLAAAVFFTVAMIQRSRM